MHCADSARVMLAAEHYLCTYGSLPKHELLEVHRSKISLHHAKSGYDYTTIRLLLCIFKACRAIRANLSNRSRWSTSLSCCSIVRTKRLRKVRIPHLYTAKLSPPATKRFILDSCGSNPSDSILRAKRSSLKALPTIPVG